LKRPIALLSAVVLAACTSSPAPTSTPAGSVGATPSPSIVLPATPQPTGTPEPTPTPVPTPTPTPGPSLAQLIGQKLMVAMDGTTAPSADLLARIKAGQVGGVILFGRNITTETALKALTKKLQGAATAGHQPPLLISTDQEGGSVKRIPWAPPTLSPPQMGSTG
jgi:beta-N-acetylhexosaminidase